jgi:hypothetical protein
VPLSSSAVRKELRPVNDAVNCDVCGRTILKGELTEGYLAPGGHRYRVCQLCFGRAESQGWIRESAAGDVPTRIPRAEPRRSLLGRLRRRRPEAAAESEEAAPAEHGPPLGAGNGADPAPYEEPPTPTRRSRSRPKDPRHVRAVPTTAEVKVERALELFNGSDHQRTVAGLSRTLGPPWVSAQPDPVQSSAVSVVVAWELSWYRYRVDLGDEADPVMMLEKGEELDQIDEYLRDWNATLDPEGRVLVGRAISDGGPEA